VLNHLAPFLLTRLLLDRVAATAPARIITVSSGRRRAVQGGGRLPPERAATVGGSRRTM
jgi:NAD(P)-dependent dehydrogenase (short-subunit alcohol dehydrogenase family)